MFPGRRLRQIVSRLYSSLTAQRRGSVPSIPVGQGGVDLPRFGKPFYNSGVDEREQWMMVPLKSYNIVLLHEGKDLNVVPASSHVRVTPIHDFGEYMELVRNLGADDEEVALAGPTGATAHAAYGVRATLRKRPFLGQGAPASVQPSIARIFKVSGKELGDTQINAKNGSGTSVVTLAVSVKRKIVLPVAFALVRHKLSKKQTNVTVSEIDEIVQYANGILEPQANVRLKIHNKRWIEVPFDHVTVNLVDGLKNPTWETWDNLLAYKDEKVTPTVFFVVQGLKRYYASQSTTSQGWTRDNHILISEKTTKDRDLRMRIYGRTLAHETLHFLGDKRGHADCHDGCGDVLEGPSSGDALGGERITKRVANMSNP